VAIVTNKGNPQIIECENGHFDRYTPIQELRMAVSALLKGETDLPLSKQ
jgi:3-deoxy-D-arabino-heptulosonate 7-phosphate (DAHP) synthase